MTQINKILSKCRVTEANGAATNIIDVYEKATLPEDATLSMIMSELKTNNDNLTISINKDQGVAETEMYDSKRDEAYSNLYHFVYGMTKLPDSQNAQTLWRIMERYGLSVTKEAYAEESSKINSLIEEMGTHTEEVLAVNGTDVLLSALTVAQNDFQDYYSSYVQSLTEKGKVQSATEVKPLVLNDINNRLVVYLRTQAEFNGDNYGDFANDVAIIIDKTNENIRERSK